MNPIKIEMTSISKLKNILERCERIRSFISENDKTPSWDGSIQVYKTATLKKKDLEGVVQVQVKGKKVESLNAQEISYPVDAADLKNFRSVGGTIFFVVYILDFDNYKIYYNPLLPLDLEQIIQTTVGKKTKVIKLVEFPKNDIKITYMLLNYIEDSKKQQSNAKIDIIKNAKQNQFDSFTFSTITPDNCLDHIFKTPIYIYGQIKKMNINIPLDKIQIESLTREIKQQVKINDKVFYNEVLIEKGNNILIVKFGAAFKFDTKTSKFTYNEKGSLKERICDLEALIELIKSNFVFSIGGVLIGKGLKQNPCNLKESEERLKYYNSLQELMINLSVKDEINLDILEDRELEELERFTNSMTNGVAISLNDAHPELFFAKFKFANLVFAILAKKIDGKKYHLENLFNERNSESCIMKRSETEDGIPSCTYLLLKKEEFIEVSNINYGNMIKSLFSIPYSEEYGGVVILLLLEMLKAFDEKKSNFELLDNIITIAKWLTLQENDNCIYKLNYLQALKRSRNLSEEENQELIIMKLEELGKNSECNFMIISGISLLLENKAEFEYYFKKMEKKY
ncbi:MAG TPA: hypothetical protein VGL27_06345, partial [Negativicutes bacterium]